MDLFTGGEVDGLEIRNAVLRVAAEIGAECPPVRTAPSPMDWT